MKQGKKLARQTSCTRMCGQESPELRLCHQHKGWGTRHRPAGPGKTLSKYQSDGLSSETRHSTNETHQEPSTHQEQTHWGLQTQLTPTGAGLECWSLYIKGIRGKVSQEYGISRYTAPSPLCTGQTSTMACRVTQRTYSQHHVTTYNGKESEKNI